MASIGHVAVGMAAARLRVGRGGARSLAASMLLWSGLSMLPDADVVGFAFGVRYGDAWGHRGATHSFVFALALGVSIGLVAGWRARRPRGDEDGRPRGDEDGRPRGDEDGRPRGDEAAAPPLGASTRLSSGLSSRHAASTIALRTALLATLVLASHGVLDTLTDGGRGCALFWPFSDERHFAPLRPIPVAPIGLGFVSERGLRVALVELVLFAPLFIHALWPRRMAGAGTRGARPANRSP